MDRDDHAARTHAERSAFGDELRRLREAAGLTREALAERAGLSLKAISALERGERRQPHLRTVTALATALGLSDTARAALVATMHQAGGTTAPAHAGPRTRPLPILPAPLIGRADDVRAVVTYLGQAGARLVTLTGPGGVGKTHLARGQVLNPQGCGRRRGAALPDVGDGARVRAGADRGRRRGGGDPEGACGAPRGRC